MSRAKHIQPKYYLHYGNDGDGSPFKITGAFNSIKEAQDNRVDSRYHRPVDLLMIDNNEITVIMSYDGYWHTLASAE